MYKRQDTDAVCGDIGSFSTAAGPGGNDGPEHGTHNERDQQQKEIERREPEPEPDPIDGGGGNDQCDCY